MVESMSSSKSLPPTEPTSSLFLPLNVNLETTYLTKIENFFAKRIGKKKLKAN